MMLFGSSDDRLLIMPVLNSSTMGLKQFSFKYFLFIVSIFLLITFSAMGQGIGKGLKVRPSWEIGLSLGASEFLNTINPNADAIFEKFNYWKPNINPALSLSIIKSITPAISAELLYFTTRLSGSWDLNKGYPIPPLAISEGLAYPNPFKTGINQLDLLISINLNQMVAPNRANDKWNLFIKGGIGAVLVRGIDALYPYTRADKFVDYALVYGGGFSYQINNRLKLNLDVILNRVETDRLDGVRELLPGLPPVGANSYYFYNLKERYISSSIGITYTIAWNRQTHFGNSTRKCAVYEKPKVKKVRRRY